MMRFLFLLALLIALDIYAFQALKTITRSVEPPLKYMLYFLFCLLPLLFLIYEIGHNRLHIFSHPVMIYLRAIIFIGYLSKFFIIIPLFIEDIVRGGKYFIELLIGDQQYDQSRRSFVSTVGIVLGAIPLISLGYGMLGNQYRYQVKKRNIPIDGLPDDLDGYRIVQISDIHSGTFAFSEPILNGIELINNLNADLVVFTGDLVNSQATEAIPFVDIFSQIKARDGIYSIMGNHDYGDYYQWSSEKERKENDILFEEVHRRLGWKLMKNEHVIIKKGQHSIGLIGVENYSSLPQFPKYGDLEKACQNMPPVDVKVLLSHDPTHWNAQVTNTYQDIVLTLSGHTHGFQFGIEVPGYIRWSPSQYVYTQWADLYNIGKQYLYVNRGFGALHYPGRVGILPEITELTLKKT